jgi:hypothetical protein
MFAAPKFVRSIKLTQYMAPTVSTRRRSTWRMIFFCSAGEKPKSSAEIAPAPPLVA